MNAKSSALTMGVERLNALLVWWGVPTAECHGTIDGQMKRLQESASDLLKTCGDAYGDQLDDLFTSNDRLVRSFQELLRSRRPQEVLAAESEIFATFLEGASRHAKRWAELSQKLQEFSTAIAREAADDIRQRALEIVSPSALAEPGRPARKQTPT